MAPILLFITGVLAGLIAGFILSRVFFRTRTGDGQGERRLLEERLLKADHGLEQFMLELQNQRQEAKTLQSELVGAKESAMGSQTQLQSIQRERDDLKGKLIDISQQYEQIRNDRESLTSQVAESREQLRSQLEQTQFLEKARADLLV